MMGFKLVFFFFRLGLYVTSKRSLQLCEAW